MLVSIAGLFAIVGSGTAPTQSQNVSKPSRMMPGTTFCNNGICEHEQTYRISEYSDGGTIDNITTYQIFCDKQMYKILKSITVMTFAAFPDATKVIPAPRESNSELLIKPNTYVYDVYMENCKPK